MTDWLIEMLVRHGAPILMLVTFLSCLALPVPASLAMLAAGAFSATGDLTTGSVAGAAFGGAVLGDQTGYAIGRAARQPLLRRIAGRPGSARLYDRARHMIEDHGGTGIFLSRWLFSPIGPSANFAAGIARLGHLRFTLWGALGEAVWVLLYVGLGRAFADDLTMAAQMAQDLGGLTIALGILAVAGLWISRSMRRHRRHRASCPGRG